MTLAILTAYTPDGGPWTDLANRVLPVLRDYALRHGYSVEILMGPYGSSEVAYPWQKTAWVRDWMQSHPESSAVWVLDIDVLITNPEIAIESFMDDGHDMFIGEDTNGLNTGSYILRNTPWAENWLNSALHLHGMATSENHAFQMLHAAAPSEDRKKTKIVEGLNSIPYERYLTLGRQEHSSQWEPDHLLLHLPGMTPQARLAIFKEIE